MIFGRVGIGMAALGAVLCLTALVAFLRHPGGGNPWVNALTMLGGVYFFTRAWAGGPESLATADLVVIMIGFGAYYGVSSGWTTGRNFWLGAIMAAAAVNVAVGLYQYWSPEAYYFWQRAAKGTQSVTGLFPNYNSFASFLNGAAFFALTYAFFGKKPLLRVLFAVASVGCIVGTVLSGSRGGWVSFVLGAACWIVVVLIYLKRERSRFFAPFLLVGVILVVAGGVTSIGLVRKLTEQRRVEKTEEQGAGESVEVDLSGEDGGRLAYHQMAIEVFLDEPVIGAGPRAFSYRSLEKWDPDSLGLWNGLPVYAHNEFFQTLSDYGLVGGLILGVVLFVHVLLGFARLITGNDRKDDLIWQLGALGGLTAILAQSFFSFLFHFPACAALLGLQLGVLGSRPVRTGRIPGRVATITASLIALCLGIALVWFGQEQGRSYQLVREGREQLAKAGTKEEIFSAFETLSEAAGLGKEPGIHGRIGRRSMELAEKAKLEGKGELAVDFNLRAKEAFESALALNPHHVLSVAGLPRVEDSLGNLEEANKSHEIAMEKLWPKEPILKAHYHAARNSYARSRSATGLETKYQLMLEARQRLDRRLEVLRRTWEQEPVKGFSQEVDSWITYFEAQLLFRKGFEVWGGRPRNPELALAFMLEAQARYLRSKEAVAPGNPSWDAEVQKLDQGIATLKSVNIVPAELTREAVNKVLTGDPGLASGQPNR